MSYISDDLTINITRVASAVLSVSATISDTSYEFKPDDVIRLKVFARKDCSDVVLQKDITVTEATSAVEIALTSEETTIGEVISKPTDYWYEVELNPETKPQTIIGYDDNGAKVFKLFPEGGVANE